MALRALLLASQLSTSDVRGTVEVVLNGKHRRDPQPDPRQQRPAAPVRLQGHRRREGQLSRAASSRAPAASPTRSSAATSRPGRRSTGTEPLSIDVAYDRTHLAQNDIATATATIRNNLSKTANMVMVDLGIPPGFDLLSEDLQAFQEKTAGAKSGRLEKFSLTATQAILYFDALAPKQTVTLTIRLRAKYPIRARTFQSRVYEYYDPEVNSVAHPVQLEISSRK